MDRFAQTIPKRLVVLVISVVAFGIFRPNEVKAEQASAPSTRQAEASSAGGENGGQDTGQDYTGQDFTSPQNLYQLRYQYKTAPGTGSLKGTIRTVATDTLYLRSD